MNILNKNGLEQHFEDFLVDKVLNTEYNNIDKCHIENCFIEQTQGKLQQTTVYYLNIYWYIQLYRIYLKKKEIYDSLTLKSNIKFILLKS